MEMGVFYTPLPVVDFIIKSVDSILRNDFNLNNGLADKSKIEKEIKENIIEDKGKNRGMEKEVINKTYFDRVQILDIATGTGTFLEQTINFIYKKYFVEAGQEAG